MGNPLLPLDEYIPDVEARVFTGSDGRERLFLYGSHDEYDMGTWCSYKYHVYSAPTEALDEWTDHGVSLASRTGEGYVWNGEECDGVPWKDALLYAPDVIQIEGRYWLASCFSGGGLGMSVSDRAEGPFSPAVQIVYDEDKTPLPSIDPTLYAEDGNVWIIWGQRRSFGAEGLVGVQLKKDENGIYSIARKCTKKWLFGDEENPDRGFGFYEGPSIRKIKEKYYLLYPSDKGKGVHMMSYATADEPLGPYTFRGNILDNDGCDLESGNDHGSLCEVNGQWYIFYHRGFGNSNMRRRVCAEKISFEADGSIRTVEMTNHGLGGPQSPYEKIEAATVTHVRMEGFKPGCYCVEYTNELHPLVEITDGNCVEYRDFDFREPMGELYFEACICSKKEGKIEIVFDKPDAEPAGELIVLEPTSYNQKTWEIIGGTLKPVTGVHTLYLRFKSRSKDNICELAYFRFRNTHIRNKWDKE